MTLIDHTRLYISEWNFAVFPVHWIRDDSTCSCRRENCRSAGKHPITADGFKSATKNIERAEAWWREYPQANIGIATGRVSGIVVLDVDPRHGGFDSLVRFSLPRTMKARTGGGGEHYYFRYPDDAEIKNSAGRLGAGLDVRGNGGYVVAPPSNHLQGVYEWEVWDGLADLPADLLESSAGVSPAVRPASCRPPEAGRIRDSHRDGGVTVAPGQRNSFLASLAGSMRRRSFSKEAITQALLIENKQRCRPPLEEAEVRGVAASISRYEVDRVDGVHRVDRVDGVHRVDRVHKVDRVGGVHRVDRADHVHLVNSENSANLANSANFLRAWNLTEFLKQPFEAKEPICFAAGRGDLAMVSARTNGGKSTLLRNCLLRLATGREFPPFVPAQRPRRVMLLDFETDEVDLQRDLQAMTAGFSAIDRDLLAENFMLVPKGMIGGELYQLNFHFNLTGNFIRQHLSEVVVIDNVSSAFNLLDENSNAEVTKKVVKPLLKLAQTSGAAVIFAHHIGKTGEGAREDVYMSRGASALSCLAKTVFNLKGRIDLGEPAEISCVKRKNGHNFSASFRLNTETRWFEPSETASSPQRKPANYDLIVAWIRENAPPGKPVKTGDIVAAFAAISRNTLMQNLRSAVDKGDISSPRRGFYCASPPPDEVL